MAGLVGAEFGAGAGLAGLVCGNVWRETHRREEAVLGLVLLAGVAARDRHGGYWEGK